MESTASAYVEVSIERKVVNGIYVYERPEELKRRGHWEGGHYIKVGLTGNWSKYGGGRSQAYQEEIQDYWFCQSCRTQQPEELSPYLYEYPEGEFLRVCAKCLSEDCSSLKGRLQSQIY